MITALIISGWIICGAFAYAICFADRQKSYPAIAEKDYRTDMSFAISMGLFFAPLALIIIFFQTGFAQHGLKWR